MEKAGKGGEAWLEKGDIGRHVISVIPGARLVIDVSSNTKIAEMDAAWAVALSARRKHL